MSNRIDLTQFEGLPDGPWGYGYWEYENTRLYEEEWDYDKIPDRIQCQRWWIVCPSDGQGHLRPKTDGPGFVKEDMVMIPCDEPTFSEGIDRRPAIVDAVNALPDLLAELKRCYDREDSLLESLNGLLDAVFWDPYEDEDTTLEIDREVAEQIRDSVNEASE